MPIYEYECLDCGKHFEIFQKISEDPLKKCRECGGHLNRLISMCSFQLKGSGWYVTDYKSSSSGGNGGQHSVKKESKSEEKAETKTETKTEAKADATKAAAAGGTT